MSHPFDTWKTHRRESNAKALVRSELGHIFINQQNEIIGIGYFKGPEYYLFGVDDIVFNGVQEATKYLADQIRLNNCKDE
jgi:hypothetical protein